MGNFIDPDRIVTDAEYFMLMGRSADGETAEIAYSHGPKQEIGIRATALANGGRVLRIERRPGTITEVDLTTASPAELSRMATDVRSISNGAGTPIVQHTP